MGAGTWLADNGIRTRSPSSAPSGGRHSSGFPKLGAPSGMAMITLTLEKSMWTKPEFTEMRFGFEVTMYIYNR